MVPANESFPKAAGTIALHVGNGRLSANNVSVGCVGGLFQKNHGGKILVGLNRRYCPLWGIRNVAEVAVDHLQQCWTARHFLLICFYQVNI